MNNTDATNLFFFKSHLISKSTSLLDAKPIKKQSLRDRFELLVQGNSVGEWDSSPGLTTPKPVLFHSTTLLILEKHSREELKVTLEVMFVHQS